MAIGATASGGGQQQQQQQGGGIIKTTARFQETEEPLRQKPIIQIDPNAPQQQYENLAALRVSIDSGRDNPFKPDGKIYKSADPIVDYYKFGPNQSRTASPTDSKLLIGYYLDDDDSSDSSPIDGKKKKKKKKKKQKRAAGTDGRKACWRRWLCCCCCCFEEGGCCRRKPRQPEPHIIGQEFDAGQYESPPSVNAKTKDFKQSKIVILQTGSNEPQEEPLEKSTILRNGQHNGTDDTFQAATTEQKNNSTSSAQQTEPKTRTKSRCVIS